MVLMQCGKLILVASRMGISIIKKCYSACFQCGSPSSSLTLFPVPGDGTNIPSLITPFGGCMTNYRSFLVLIFLHVSISCVCVCLCLCICRILLGRAGSVACPHYQKNLEGMAADHLHSLLDQPVCGGLSRRSWGGHCLRHSI